jgi:hypothetical protein
MVNETKEQIVEGLDEVGKLNPPEKSKAKGM